jgi:FtsH-binding integral membrane protein
VDDVTRPFYGVFAVLLLCLACGACWFSLSGYLAFFRLSDVVEFSWKVGGMIFFSPLIFYFSYMAFYVSFKNKPIRVNNKLGGSLAFLVLIGVIIGLLSSIYIDHNLRARGYEICAKSSWMLPGVYVKDIKLC